MQQGDSIYMFTGWEYHGAPYKADPTLRVISTGNLYVDVGVDSVTYGATVYDLPSGGVVFNGSTMFWAMPLVRQTTTPYTPLVGHVNHAGVRMMRGFRQDDRVRRMTINVLNRMAGVVSGARQPARVRVAAGVTASAGGVVYDLRGALLSTGAARPSKMPGAYIVVPQAHAASACLQLSP
jgi:hypothetical protein